MGTRRRSRALGCIVLTVVAGVAAGCGGGAASQVTVRAQQYPGDTAATRRRLASLARTFEAEARCAPGEQVDVTGIAPGVYGVSGCKAFRDYQLVCGANDLAAAFRVQHTICEWEPLPDLRATAAAALGCTPDNLVGRVENGQRVVEGCGARAAYGVECRGGCRWAVAAPPRATHSSSASAAATHVQDRVPTPRPNVRAFIHRAACSHPRWAPSGDRLMCVAVDDTGYRIRQLSASGEVLQDTMILENEDASDPYATEAAIERVVWNADASALAFVQYEHRFAGSDSFERWEDVYFISVAGVGEQARILELTMCHFDLFAWHPTGTRLLGTECGPLLEMRVSEDPQAVPEERGEGRAGAWSPDGSRLAILREQSGHSELVIGRADGSAARRFARLAGDSPHNLIWSPDGEWLAFMYRDRGGATQLAFARAGGPSRPRAVQFTGTRPRVTFTWLPDSSSVLATTGDALVHVIRDGSTRSLLSASDSACIIDSLDLSPTGDLAYSETCERGVASSLRVLPATDPRLAALRAAAPLPTDPPAAAPGRVPAPGGSLTGTYPYVHGDGSISLRELPGGDLEAAIHTSTESLSQCNFTGTLQRAGGVGGARRWIFREAGEDWAGPCEVTLDVAGDRLSVSAAGCRAYCGNAAGLDGEATHPPRTPSFRPLERY